MRTRIALFAVALLCAVGLSASVATADSCACGGYTWQFAGRSYNGSTTACYWVRGDGATLVQAFAGNVGCPAYP